MKAQQLDRVLTCYMIGDPAGEYPIFDATGSTLYPGRWNAKDTPMIYTSERYSTALLEKLVHGSGILPPNQHYIRITIPNGVSYEVLSTARLPQWASADAAASRQYGVEWHRARRSLLLIVPSVVARMDNNFLINPEHDEFTAVNHSLHRPVWWDDRLYEAEA